MKHLIEYRYHFESLFFSFVTNKISLVELIDAMKRLEAIVKDKNETPENGFWFKFGTKDTLCTTIADLERDLEPSNKNYCFTFDKLIDACHLNAGLNDSEIFVYFS